MAKQSKTKKKNLTNLVDTQFIPWEDEERMRHIHDTAGMAIFELRAGCGGKFRKRQENILENYAPQQIREHFSLLFLRKLERLRARIRSSKRIDILKQNAQKKLP